MAKNITLMGADYPDVPAVQLPQTGGGTATFYDIEVVDNLNSDSSTDALSAKQGKVLKNIIVVEHKTSPQFTVSASSWSTQYLDIAKTGYTPKMVSVVTTTNTQCVLIGAGIQSTNPSNAMITVKNVSGSSQTCTLEYDVLYIAN